MSPAISRMPSSVAISSRIGPVLNNTRNFVASAVMNATLSGGNDPVSGSSCHVGDHARATDALPTESVFDAFAAGAAAAHDAEAIATSMAVAMPALDIVRNRLTFRRIG